jgi:hypothetical protein
MTRFGRFARITAVVAAWALLLQAAAPMLAAWAAQRQGVAVAEICELHGVAMPRTASHAKTAGDDDSSPSGHHGTAAGHCALLALGAFAPPGANIPLPASAPAPRHCAARVALATPRQDDCARWIARLHHGPPAKA